MEVWKVIGTDIIKLRNKQFYFTMSLSQTCPTVPKYTNWFSGTNVTYLQRSLHCISRVIARHEAISRNEVT